MADNIASQGNKVIIFSLEQSRFELVCKSLSRLTHEIKPADHKTHTAIMQSESFDEITQKALERYQSTIAPNLIIEEGNFNTSVDTIREYVADFVANTKERPTLVIDYLQILAPSNPKFTDKQQVDYNVTSLKKISRDYNIPIIVISSFNRMNYKQTASYEAFKESGGIEYTADVLFTMQLTILKNKELVTNEDLNNAKKENPRQVQLVCLKNRNGISYFDIDFLYNPVFNHFETKEEYNRKHNIKN